MKIKKRNNHTAYVSDMSKAPIICTVTMLLLADILNIFGQSVPAIIISLISTFISLATLIYCFTKHSAVLSTPFNFITSFIFISFILLPFSCDDPYFLVQFNAAIPILVIFFYNILSIIQNYRKRVDECEDATEEAKLHVKYLQAQFPIDVTNGNNFEFDSPEYQACFLFAYCRETLLNMSEKDFLSWFIHNQREITIPNIIIPGSTIPDTCSYKGKDVPAVVSYLAFLRSRELRR